jgi:hypothetical protein
MEDKKRTEENSTKRKMKEVAPRGNYRQKTNYVEQSPN